jgi:hypothetical protein
MKCPECRAEIISNSVKTCPYCGSSLIPSENSKKAGRVTNNQTKDIAAMIKEAIEAQKAFHKSEKEVTKKLEKEVNRNIEKGIRKKYSTIDIVILLVSLTMSFIVLALTLSLLLRR